MNRATWVRGTAVAGLIGAGFWVVKLTTIAVRGESGHWVDMAAFGFGLLGILIGATSIALRLARGVVATVSGCVLALVVAFLLMPALTNVSVALFGEDTFAGSEGGLILLALVSVIIGLTGLRVATPQQRQAATS